MKIIDSDFLKFNQIKNRKIPKLNPDLETLLDEWAFSNDTTEALTGHEVLEKILSLVTDDTFYQLYQTSKPFNYTFEIKTTQLNPITIRFFDGGFNDPDAIFISDGKEEYKYRVLVLQEEETLQVASSEVKDLKTGFIQRYNRYEDSFTKPNLGINIDVIIQNPEFNKNEGPFYLIDENIKNEFKNTTFKNVVDVYHFIVNNAFPRVQTFTITTTDINTNKETGKIVVEKGIIKTLKIEKTIKGKKTIIEQHFEEPTQSNDPEYLAKQDEIIRNLIRN